MSSLYYVHQNIIKKFHLNVTLFMMKFKMIWGHEVWLIAPLPDYLPFTSLCHPSRLCPTGMDRKQVTRKGVNKLNKLFVGKQTAQPDNLLVSHAFRVANHSEKRLGGYSEEGWRCFCCVLLLLNGIRCCCLQ